ncbi:HIV Tat-specific factor 1 homolog [Drosophila pseudoobscura]|uniref:17S U2 SnRNP complex component HTATSF1 n=1 Tax=Drosophila pseudoobscura pseudoobscura TaxID=46245 RepID=A0A6I8UEA5_DROPS|nr:HIV Tat-specific factor 1 homolog [Drosophila pseudoobscura]
MSDEEGEEKKGKGGSDEKKAEVRPETAFITNDGDTGVEDGRTPTPTIPSATATPDAEAVEEEPKEIAAAQSETKAVNDDESQPQVKDTEVQKVNESQPQIKDAAKKDDESKPQAKDEEAMKKDKSESHQDFAAYAEHVTYAENGDAIYTDPSSKQEYKWCNIKNSWLPMSGNGEDPYENEFYKWCDETSQWLPKTQTETEHYRWDEEQHTWVLKQQPGQDAVYKLDEKGERTYTDKDGTVYLWDAEKSAWFPKIDDDFMAQYQMNYGFIDNTSAGEKEKADKEIAEAKRKEEELKRMTAEAEAAMARDESGVGPAASLGKRKAPEPPKWFEMDPSQNTKVYVDNLPLDITKEEFAELMGKCGMVMRDPKTQQPKLKLYTEADGQFKGDGLCDYIKVESVHLALKILDDYDLRGHKIRVQRAQFQMRGEYNPALKPKRKKKDKEKMQKMKEKLFDWRPDKMRGERSKHEKTVILKNLFTPELFEKEVELILEYQNNLREECGKCGMVRKVVIYDRHPEGIAQINMSSPEEADLVIQMMQGRFFGQRQLTADHWDGQTKYKIDESAVEAHQRLSKWDEYLAAEEADKQDKQDKQNAGGESASA